MSGRKNTLLKYKLLSAASMAANITSAATNIQHLDNIGIQANIVSGSPTGVIQVQVSADYAEDTEHNVLDAGHWVDLTPAQQSITAGSPAQTYFDLNQLSSPWVRVVYTRTSGSGSLDVFITAKML